MKILYIAPGNSIHSKKWIEKIKSLHPKNNYFWFSYEEFQYEIDKEIKIFSISGNKFFRLIRIIYCIFEIGKLQKKNNFDLIHIHSVGTYGTFAIIPILFNIPFIVTPWGSDIIFGSRKFINSLIMKLIFIKASLITCDALHISKLISKISSKANPKIINFGIDSSFFVGSLRNNIDKKSINIISTRNHEKIYNLETLINTSKDLENNNIDFSLTIAGYGSQTEILMQKSKDLGLLKKVRFIGRYDYRTLPELLNKNDLFISTSLSDAGIASSIAEAMACQKIVIVSDSGENKLWISNGVNGFLFKTGCSKSLYNAIIEAIDKKHLWNEIGSKARETILERNDISNEMKKMWQLMDLV